LEATFKAVVEFQISTRWTGTKRVVKVKVYDDLVRLRRDADRWDDRRGISGTNANAYGVCHRFERALIHEGGAEESTPYCAYIRLLKDACRTGVITHECTHAALWIYQLGNDMKMDPMVEDIEKEEELCYLVGDLSSKVVSKLYEHGVLPG
jgi:hypothetical protein